MNHAWYSLNKYVYLVHQWVLPKYVYRVHQWVLPECLSCNKIAVYRWYHKTTTEKIVKFQVLLWFLTLSTLCEKSQKHFEFHFLFSQWLFCICLPCLLVGGEKRVARNCTSDPCVAWWLHISCSTFFTSTSLKHKHLHCWLETYCIFN